LFLRRHLQIFVHVSHRADQQTLIRVAWNNRRTRLSPFERAFARIQDQAALNFLCLMAVAFEAVVREDGLNLLFEKLALLLRKLDWGATRISRANRSGSPKQGRANAQRLERNFEANTISGRGHIEAANAAYTEKILP